MKINIIWLIFLFEYILLSSLVLLIHLKFQELYWTNSGDVDNLASEFNVNASTCCPFSMCLVWSSCKLLLFCWSMYVPYVHRNSRGYKKKGCWICQSPILYLMWYPCSLSFFLFMWQIICIDLCTLNQLCICRLKFIWT